MGDNVWWLTPTCDFQLLLENVSVLFFFVTGWKACVAMECGVEIFWLAAGSAEKSPRVLMSRVPEPYGFGGVSAEQWAETCSLTARRPQLR